MLKSILLTATSLVAISSAASASSWEDAIAKAKAYEAKTGNQGQWIRGKDSSTVFKKHNGASGFIFGNVFADDVVLPMITDIRAIIEASKSLGTPILVASNEWILPSNPMLCEIAEQIGMDCAEFTRLFHMYSVKDSNGNYVGDDEAIKTLDDLQAQVMGYVADLGVEASSDSISPAVEALQATIEMLKSDATANAAVIDVLNGQIAELTSELMASNVNIEALNADFAAAVASEAAVQELLKSEEFKSAKLEAELELADKQIISLKSTIVDLEASVQDGINALHESEYYATQKYNTLVVARDNLQKLYDDLNAVHTATNVELTAKLEELHNVSQKLNTTTKRLAWAVTSFNTNFAAHGVSTTAETLYADIAGAISVAEKASFQAGIDSLDDDIAILELKLSNAESKLATVTADRDYYYDVVFNEETGLLTKVSGLEGEVAALDKEAIQLNNEITSLNNEVSSLKASLTYANDLANSHKVKIDELNGLLSADQSKIADLVEAIEGVQSEIALIQGGVIAAGESVTFTVGGQDFTFSAAPVVVEETVVYADFSDIEGANNQKYALVDAVDGSEAGQIIEVEAINGADWSAYADYKMFKDGGTFINTGEGFVKVEANDEVVGEFASVASESFDESVNSDIKNGILLDKETTTVENTGLTAGESFIDLQQWKLQANVYAGDNIIWQTNYEYNTLTINTSKSDGEVVYKFDQAHEFVVPTELQTYEGWKTFMGHMSDLADDVAAVSYDAGFNEGYDQGFDDGYDAGYVDGVNGTYNK